MVSEYAAAPAGANGPSDVDMRAEVGLITRDLVLSRGRIATREGPRIIVNGSASVDISNFQCLNCGQVSTTQIHLR